jgi:hypothetical protein
VLLHPPPHQIQRQLHARARAGSGHPCIIHQYLCTDSPKEGRKRI